MNKRLLPVLVYGMPLLALSTLACAAAYFLAEAVADGASARLYGGAAVFVAALTIIDSLALVALLGFRALAEVE